MKKNPDFELAASALSRKPKAKAKAKKSKKSPVRHISVKKAEGGFVVTHHPEGMGDPKEHVVPNMAELQAHMAQHMSDEPEAADNAKEEAGE